MRKLLGLFFVLVAFTTSAQLKLGIEAGYDIAQYSDKGGSSQDYSLSAINAYHIGLCAEQKLSSEWFLTMQVQFSRKGSILNTTSQALSGSNYTTKLNYIVIPAIMNYKFDISKSSKVIIGAGLYWGAGISGKRNGFDNTLNQTINDKINFTTDTDNSTDNKIKPFDWGYVINLGIEWEKYQFKINYNNSLSDIKPNGDTKFYNQGYGLSVAYLLPW